MRNWPVSRILILIFWMSRAETYTLFDGLTYNTHGYFVSCVVFLRALKGQGKIRAMSKMSACIIIMLNHGIRDLLFR